MFTGIIEEVGMLQSIRKNGASAVLAIQAEKILEDVKLGDSIAVNGICLTVTSYQKGRGSAPGNFTADVMHETLNRSSIGTASRGSRVNLERAMRADGRFGGHIVTGHIDGTGIVREIHRDANAVWYKIETEPAILRCIAEKGSIAIDGVSLTVAGLTQDTFSVSVIPHTASNTILGERKTGDVVNLENDCIGKYVQRMLSFAEPAKEQTGISRDLLRKYGF